MGFPVIMADLQAMFGSILHGFLVSGSLIVAIGAQNAFVLKQGLKQEHVFWVCLTCFLCDFILISLGVLGFGSLISQNTTIKIALSLLGAVFLFIYGLRSFISAYKSNQGLTVNPANQSANLQKTLATTLALTLLNPHVYLDTVILIGSITSALNLKQKYLFLSGAVSASALWFFDLGFGAKLLIGLFAKPITWRILDGSIGCVMWIIAFGFIRYVLTL